LYLSNLKAIIHKLWSMPDLRRDYNNTIYYRKTFNSCIDLFCFIKIIEYSEHFHTQAN